MRKPGQYSNFLLSSHIPLTARGFKDIAGKGGGVERDKSNIQSIRDMISFRMYDTYFHHDTRGHGAEVHYPEVCNRPVFVLFLVFGDFLTDFYLFFCRAL